MKEKETLAELVKRYGVHPQQISDWKHESLSRRSEIFSIKSPEPEAKIREKKLYEKISRFELEVDSLHEASERLGIVRASKKR